MYDPGGFTARFPIVSVPPMLIEVRPGEGVDTLKGETGSDTPMLSPNVPPLLPVSVASGPFKIDNMVPSGASTSKKAWQ